MENDGKFAFSLCLLFAAMCVIMFWQPVVVQEVNQSDHPDAPDPMPDEVNCVPAPHNIVVQYLGVRAPYRFGPPMLVAKERALGQMGS